MTSAPEQCVGAAHQTTLEWTLSQWLTRAAANSNVTVSVWVGEKLYVHRDIAVPTMAPQAADPRLLEPVKLKLNFGRIPSGEHTLTVVFASHSILPRFAPQIQTTRLSIVQTSPTTTAYTPVVAPAFAPQHL